MATDNINELSPKIGISILRAINPVFKEFAKEECVEKSNLITAFGRLNIEIKLSELDQLLAGACIAGRRIAADYLTKGEFALSAVEFIRFKQKQSSVAKSYPTSRTYTESNLSTDAKHYDVFLGGSCNPTTWRLAKAIPYLESVGISYYNPQVDDWYPELIQIEEDAKRNSTIKFFVFDSETRGIASLVETAFMVSIGWQLIVVLHYLPESKEVKIAGEILSKQEVKDLNRGRSFLCDILEKNGIPVFDNLDNALKCTYDVIKGKVSYEQLLMRKRGSTTHQYGDWLLQIRELFDKFSGIHENRRSICQEGGEGNKIPILYNKRGSVPNFLETDLQSGELTSLVLAPSLTPNAAISALEIFLQTRSLNSSIQNELSFLDLIGIPIDFEVFCHLAAEAAYQHNNSLWNWGSSVITNFFQYTYSLLNNALNPSTEQNSIDDSTFDSPVYDVFLGGTCASTTWRKQLAIPILESNQISYFNPQLPPEEWSIRKIADENFAKKASKALIFVISTDSPSIASMTESAYLIASTKAVFLEIENINPTSGNFNYPLSLIACKDYNRGRAYLKKTAELFNVPVFHTIEETLDSIVKYYAKPTD